MERITEIIIFLKENILKSFLVFAQIIISCILINLPLTKYFSFEYSLVTGVFLTLFISIYVIHLLKIKKVNNYKELNTKIIRIVTILFFIPLIIAFINSQLSGQCPFCAGLPFYFVIVVPAIFIGRGIGILAYSIWSKYPGIMLILLFLIILCIPITELYYNPQVYFYNPIAAYFPGNIYDESITISTKFIIYRLLNLLFFESLVFLYFNNKVRVHLPKSGIIIFSVIISVSFVLISPYSGFATNYSGLKSKLAFQIETKHFRFNFSEKPDDGEADYIRKSAEYYYEELREFYKTEPKEKIEAFVFSSRKEKKEIFGAGNADVAKPWLGQIYLTKESLHSTLKHETSHIFTSEFGKYIFKVADRFNPALIEGIASASDNSYDDYDIHYIVNTAYKTGYKISITELFSGFNFFNQASSASYVIAGSFIKYLVDKYGIDKFKLLYSDTDFPKYYKKNISELNAEYLIFLDSQASDVSPHKANYYFGRKGLMQKICPRYLATKTEEVYGYIINKEYVRAKSLIEELEINNVSWALTYGKSICYEKMDSAEAGVTYLTEKERLYTGTAYEPLIKLRRADMLILAGRVDKAKLICNSLINEKPVHRVYYPAFLRIYLMSNLSVLKSYIKGDESEKFRILNEEFKNSGVISLIPIMIDLNDNLRRKVDFMNDKTGRDVVEDSMIENPYQQYAVYKLAEYYLEGGNYERVKILLEKLDKCLNKSEYSFVITNLKNKFYRIYS